MGKTLNRDERKNSKYISRDNARQRKADRYTTSDNKPRREKPRQKWRPHSEIEAE